jgi:hypothetical protein
MTSRIVPGGFYVIGYAIIDHGQPIAVCPDLLTAKRLGELIDRHGLVDVPDTIAGVDG